MSSELLMVTHVQPTSTLQEDSCDNVTGPQEVVNSVNGYVKPVVEFSSKHENPGLILKAARHSTD
jgi:hypothetical protein